MLSECNPPVTLVLPYPIPTPTLTLLNLPWPYPNREILGAQVFKDDPLDVLYPDEEDLAFAAERLKPVKESLSPIFLTRLKVPYVASLYVVSL